MMAHKVDISHIDKFDGSYYNIWQHRLKLIFMMENLFTVVDGSEIKPVAPSAANIVARTQALHVTGAGSIRDWEQKTHYLSQL